MPQKSSENIEIDISEATKKMNPLRQIREKYGMDRNQMSIMLGIAYMPIYNIETGNLRKIGPSVREALISIGINIEEFEANYEAWRRIVREEMIRNIVTVRGRDKQQEQPTSQAAVEQNKNAQNEEAPQNE